MTRNTIDKDEVLRKVGRNVVVLQKMEGMLKKLVTIQGATFSADDQESFHRRTAAIGKKPLGHLVSEFLRSAYSSETSSDAIEESERRATISLSFKLDPEMEKEHGESLSSVVKERNALIHRCSSHLILTLRRVERSWRGSSTNNSNEFDQSTSY